MRSKDRQYIPIMPAKPAPSLWQRVRGAASTAIAAVRSAGVRVIAFVARKATGARAALSRVARAAMTRRPWVLTRQGAGHAATRTTVWCRDTWHRVVRPFMRVRVTALGIVAVVVGLVVAPIATLVTLAGCGAALIGLSRLIQRLESSAHPAARVALRVIEVAAQVLRVVAYVAAGAAVLAISAVSAAFAVTEVLELVLRYLDVPLAASLAALTFFVLTASWGLGIVEIAWLLVHERKASARAARPRSEGRQAIPLIRIDAERAWNGETAEPLATEEEMQETMDMIDSEKSFIEARATKCMGCDLDDASPRFGLGDMTSLCGECLEYLAEDELVEAADRGEVSAKDVTTAIRAGVSVPAYVIVTTGARLRSTRINLDLEDITCRTKARVLSEQDLSRVHWAETGWWFDARGNRHARQWHGFVGGQLVTRAEYEHVKGERGFYATSLVSGTPESWDRGPYRTLVAAQEAAADEISDHRAANVPGLEAVLDGALRSPPEQVRVS